MNIQARLYSLFEEPDKSRASFLLNTGVYVLIIISILNLMLYSVESINEQYGDLLDIVRHTVMPLFIVEYLLRLYASGHLEEYRGMSGKLKYMLTPYAIIDLLSVLPYLLMGAGINSSFVRSLRLLRIFRLFRVKKYSIFIRLMKKILSEMKEELVVLLFFTVVILVVLSFIIFDIEHRAQPEVFSNIFQTMWWSVATLTTVGYGDMYPVSAAGKLITGVISILGIGFIAIPGGMFAFRFTDAVANHREIRVGENGAKCYRCGSHDLKMFRNQNLILDNSEPIKNDLLRCNVCGLIFVKDDEYKSIQNNK